METRAISKGNRISPRKARMTMDLVRGKSLFEARNILNNTNTKASRMILKTLNSAAANATNNHGLNEADLFISECFVNQGQTLKRVKIASHAKVARNDHRTSHIIIKLSDGKNEVSEEAK